MRRFFGNKWVWIGLLLAVVAVGMFFLGRWQSPPAQPNTVSISAPTPQPQPTLTPLANQPPVVNVIVSQSVNGIATESSLPLLLPPLMSKMFGVEKTGRYKFVITDRKSVV